MSGFWHFLTFLLFRRSQCGMVMKNCFPVRSLPVQVKECFFLDSSIDTWTQTWRIQLKVIWSVTTKMSLKNIHLYCWSRSVNMLSSWNSRTTFVFFSFSYKWNASLFFSFLYILSHYPLTKYLSEGDNIFSFMTINIKTSFASAKNESKPPQVSLCWFYTLEGWYILILLQIIQKKIGSSKSFFLWLTRCMCMEMEIFTLQEPHLSSLVGFNSENATLWVWYVPATKCPNWYGKVTCNNFKCCLLCLCLQFEEFE